MMQMFKAYLKRYANVVQDMQSPTDIAIKTLAESIDQIDASINIDIICRQNKTKGERPPLYDFEPYVVSRYPLKWILFVFILVSRYASFILF